jgi:hypothetical protein
MALGIKRSDHTDIDDEEYIEVFKEGHHRRIAYYEDLYVEAMMGKTKANPTMIIFFMKQLGWADKMETKQHTSRLFEKKKDEETLSKFKLKEKKNVKKTSSNVSLN